MTHQALTNPRMMSNPERTTTSTLLLTDVKHLVAQRRLRTSSTMWTTSKTSIPPCDCRLKVKHAPAHAAFVTAPSATSIKVAAMTVSMASQSPPSIASASRIHQSSPSHINLLPLPLLHDATPPAQAENMQPNWVWNDTLKEWKLW